jgi:chromosomal replication initiator protein
MDLHSFAELAPPPKVPPLPTKSLALVPGPEAEKIVAEVAEKHGLTVADLKGPSQRHAIAHPRQEAMWRLYMTGRYSYPAIGRLLGGRDHSTVMLGARKHDAKVRASA